MVNNNMLDKQKVSWIANCTLVNKTSKIYQYKEYFTNLIITITSLSDYLTINDLKFCLKGQNLNHVVFCVLDLANGHQDRVPRFDGKQRDCPSRQVVMQLSRSMLFT